ncbi:MAG: discoidin domain-containing protein [Candidatus Manganitrophus sp. SB1]|nr:discoidin domain-containing protein [Candidatus Manganitrophus morganii]
MIKHAAVEMSIAAVTALIALIKRNRSFALAIAMTAIFYLPALRNGSVDAGFLYGGDTLGWYLPALAKTQMLIHSFNFTAIDFSSYNGSSDFFLSPNFFAYHPFVVIYSLLAAPETTTRQDLGRFLVLMFAAHSFLACYFSLKLFTRFFSFEFGPAALIAAIFAFSLYMMNSLTQPSFLLCATIIPWAAYSALAYSEGPNLRRLVFACLPVVIGFMGGYMPLGVACLALSAGLVAAKLLVIDDSISLDERVRALFFAATPYLCASLIVSPYLYAVYKFHKETTSVNVVSLFYSAYQLAELPQTFLRLISSHFDVPGPSYEFSLAWGLIAITTAAIFILSPKTMTALTARDWKIFKVSAFVYFAAVLAIFGHYSVVSDLVYYLVPQVGKMHIYQRFLLPTYLLFAVMVALMLKALVQVRPPVALRVVLTILVVATLVAAYIVSRNPVLAKEMGLNNYLIFELLLACLFAFTLLIPDEAFVYGVAIVLFCLPPLDRMYDFSVGGSTFEEQRKRQGVILDEGEKARFVSYLKRFDDKEVIKYVDITPMWTKGGVETFPKVFPYYVLKDLRLSSYGGFTFYLSARADYMRRMPVMGEVAVSPDWEVIENSGADFVVARESDLGIGALGALFTNIKTDELYRLPNDAVVLPLHTRAVKVASSDSIIFDNGYFRAFPNGNEPNKLENIALGKPARQSSNGGGEARLAVDGNTNGDYNLGSVTHTGGESHSWLEIDLGAVEPIDSIRVWNRTDCCGFRLNNYWIFISEIPFLPSDTASELRTRPATWSKVNFTPNPKGTIKTGGVRGRYIRVQLSGTSTDQGFLSLAEVEVFRSAQVPVAASVPASVKLSDLKVREFATDHASYLRLDLESSSPTTVQYLFWHNPRLRYYLNGKRVKWVEQDGLRTLSVPAGRNLLEIRYRHWPLTGFWILYTIYGLIFLWALMPTEFRTGVWRKLRWPRSMESRPGEIS